MGRAVLRRLPESLLAGRERSALREGRLGREGRLAAVLAGAAAGVGAGAAAVLVRVGRASDAERTLLGPVLYRPATFLPPVVRALRRSRAASRLDVLAISAR